MIITNSVPLTITVTKKRTIENDCYYGASLKCAIDSSVYFPAFKISSVVTCVLFRFIIIHCKADVQVCVHVYFFPVFFLKKRGGGFCLMLHNCGADCV